MVDEPLAALGWSDGWQARLDEHHAHATPGRVVRHDGVALAIATASGTDVVHLTTRLDPEPTVGDWVALRDGQVAGVLPRTSLLRRRAAVSDTEQVLAANVDVVILVCGLDRPVKDGRIQRGATLAAEAGAEPVVVLTKAAIVDAPEETATEVRAANPGIDVLVTSVQEGQGLDGLQQCVAGRTVTLLGESGAGKSSIVNALLGDEVALVGHVRSGDHRGRHTTTNRVLHLLPNGGALIDTPGIRSVGLWGDPDSVDTTFADISALAEGCRFGDCAHDREPDCAVRDAVASGQLEPSRLSAWRALGDEATATATRAAPKRRRR